MCADFKGTVILPEMRLDAWRERGVSVACQLRGGCVAFSMSLHTRSVSDTALLLLGDILVTWGESCGRPILHVKHKYIAAKTTSAVLTAI